jgi:hypothetical protein
LFLSSRSEMKRNEPKRVIVAPEKMISQEYKFSIKLS